ncbi:MAG: AraC family transcriptional regulator, partial [Flavipsychrobacter sp.]
MTEDTGYMRYIGKEISPEQFVAEHTFIFIEKGIMNLYDGTEHKFLKAGDYCMARKNRLGRFNKMTVNDELEKMFVYFD